MTGVDEFPEAEGFGGFAGKSLQDYVRDDIDKALVAWETYSNDENDEHISEYSAEHDKYLEGLVKGMCHVLAKLRGTKMQVELDESYDRVEEKERAEDNSTSATELGENSETGEEESKGGAQEE